MARGIKRIKLNFVPISMLIQNDLEYSGLLIPRLITIRLIRNILFVLGMYKKIDSRSLYKFRIVYSGRKVHSRSCQRIGS